MIGLMSSLEQTKKSRPASEWASEKVFRPIAQYFVDPMARLGVNPLHLVMLHTALGLYAAYQIRQGGSFVPAILIQIKTILDGLDGQLARATGQTTETGRYLDTEMDLVVNFGLNVAILGAWGVPATLLQSLILSTDFVWEREYRLARGEVFRDSPASNKDNPKILKALKAFYATYFIPQEILLNKVSESRLRQIISSPAAKDRIKYIPLTATAITSNMGLSTQMLILGACVLAKRPKLYAATLVIQAFIIIGVQLWRESKLRSAKLQQ